MTWSCLNFNPLHHEGGDLNEHRVSICFIISIHSTTRVETFRRSTTNCGLSISIHSTTRVETVRSRYLYHSSRFQSTPPRGWRHRIESACLKIYNFNPLHHEGGDYLYDNRCHYIYPISIHSTTRVETLKGAGFENDYYIFQSTPPRGWRLCCHIGYTAQGHFNPLHHEGGDIILVLLHPAEQISIHSTTRVETR